MNGSKLIIAVIAAIVFVAAIVVAIYLFRKEITDILVDVKSRIDEKILHRDEEYVE